MSYGFVRFIAVAEKQGDALSAKRAPDERRSSLYMKPIEPVPSSKIVRPPVSASASAREARPGLHCNYHLREVSLVMLLATSAAGCGAVLGIAAALVLSQ